MTRTLTQVRQLTAQQLGLRFISGTSSSGASTTTLIDTILTSYGNDKLIGLHVLLTSGSPSETELQITDSVQSTGTVTFRPTLGAAPNALDYEILPFSGTDFTRAIQDSVLELYSQGHLIRPFRSYVAYGSPIYNADLSYWDGAATIDGWTLSGSTLARERTITYLTPTSAKLTGSSGTVTLDAKYRQYLLDLRGETVTLHWPVYADAADSARINLYNGSNNYSSYHTGNSSWQVLSVEVELTQTATDVYPQMVRGGSGSNYFGMPWIEYSGNTPIPVPLNLLPDGPTYVGIALLDLLEDEISSNVGVLEEASFGKGRSIDFDFIKHMDENVAGSVGFLNLFNGSSNVLAILQGEGPLTVPTANTDVLEVSHSESMMIAVQAAILILTRALNMVNASSRRDLQDTINRLEERLAVLIRFASQATDSAPLQPRW